jgi:pyrimidine-nucleoside phosphorylase
VSAPAAEAAVRLIDRKRRGEPIAAADLAALVDGYCRGDVPDYQMAAFLMAVVWRGLDDAETAALTDAMVRSGETLAWTDMPGPVVDKHSTGGVGDGVTLVLAPLLAACGACVAKLSGRALGHTGGTLDKLESIPGLRTDLTPEAMAAQVRRVRVAVAGQSARLAPADGLLYALRDATATVASPGLIAASVMAKKIAGGAASILLDVKCGSGALVATPPEAADLARRMIGLGRAAGRQVHAVVSDMAAPLLDAAGNAVEVEAAVRLLAGGGPAAVRDLCVALAGRLCALCGLEADAQAGAVRARRALDSGAALAAFARWVAAQGGDPRVAEAPDRVLPRARLSGRVASPGRGYLRVLDARAVGEAAHLLGAGRSRKGEPVDPAAGVVLRARVGQEVGPGDSVAELRTADSGRRTRRERDCGRRRVPADADRARRIGRRPHGDAAAFRARPPKVGAATYVYASAAVTGDSPAGVTTLTSTVPGLPGGVRAVTAVAETATTSSAGVLPNSTSVAPARSVPHTVTAWPPAAPPTAGTTALTVGPGPLRNAAAPPPWPTPTARQRPSAAHATPSARVRPTTGWAGTATPVAPMAAHTAVCAGRPTPSPAAAPTAVHAAPAGHATAVRLVADGTGRAAAPSPALTATAAAGPDGRTAPTARQAAADGQATPSRRHAPATNRIGPAPSAPSAATVIGSTAAPCAVAGATARPTARHERDPGQAMARATNPGTVSAPPTRPVPPATGTNSASPSVAWPAATQLSAAHATAAREAAPGRADAATWPVPDAGSTA